MPSTKITEKKVSKEAVGEVLKTGIIHETNQQNEEQTIFIYVGPSVKGLQRYSSFIGGYPKHFEKELKESPAFKKMFIKPEELSEFENKIQDGNSVESMLFTKTKDYFKEVK